MRLFVSTCGTSLLSNQADKLRPLLTQHANAKNPQEDYEKLRACAKWESSTSSWAR